MNELIDVENLTPEQLQQLGDAVAHQRIKKLEKGLSSVKKDVNYLKEEQPIHPASLARLERKRRKRVIEALGGKESQAYKKISQKVFSEAGRDFKTLFNIPRYDLLPKKYEAAAFDYWDDWVPSTNSRMEINALNNQLELIQGGDFT